MRVLLSAVLAVFVPATFAHADPITLTLKTDKITHGFATLTATLPAMPNPDTEFIGFIQGTNWKIAVDIRDNPLSGISVGSSAQHISAPAPHTHKGEKTPGAIMILVQKDAGAAFLATPHANSSIGHMDILRSRLFDLNGKAPGFLGPGRTISAEFDMAHTPEPSTLILVSSGLLVGGRKAWKRRTAPPRP
jgi:hypothetical protein